MQKTVPVQKDGFLFKKKFQEKGRFYVKVSFIT